MTIRTPGRAGVRGRQDVGESEVCVGGDGKCVEVLNGTLGDERDWQDVLDRAARIRKVGEYEPGVALVEVEDRAGKPRLYAVEEQG